MTTTPDLGIPYIAGQQAQPEVTHNEAISLLQSLLNGVIDRGLNTPPGSPVEGDAYIIGAAPTGAWANYPNAIAVYFGTAWLFLPGDDDDGDPITMGARQEGLRVWVRDEDAYYVWRDDGASPPTYSWQSLLPGSFVGLTDTPSSFTGLPNASVTVNGAANALVFVKNNWGASAAPTANDDDTEGYSVGSLWFDTTAGETYRCVDASTGAADWVNTSLELSELGSMATQDANGVTITGGTIDGINVTNLLDKVADETVSGAWTFSGVAQFSNGSTTVPSITFANDPDTGLSRNVENRLNFLTGGVRRIWLDNNRLAIDNPLHILMAEITDPSPVANSGQIYMRDNGSGKTQFVAQFPTGAVQVIATEP